MRKTLLISLNIIFVLAGVAQSIYNNGARIVSESGSYWVVSGGNFTLTSESATNLASVSNLKIESGAALTLTSASFLTVVGSIQNNGTLTGNTGSKVILSGASAQVFSGSGASTFDNLTLDNTNGLTLTNADITVNGTLKLTNGLVTTGSNSAIVGPSGIIANAGSTKYINGKLAQTFSSAGSKVFPIGKGGNYRPVTFNYAALTGTSVVTAEQTESGMTGILPVNTALFTAGRFWTISQTGGSDIQYYLTLDATGYTPSNTVLMLKKDAGTILSHVTKTPNYTNASALTSMGDFTLGESTCLLATGPAPKVADLVVNGLGGSVIKWYASETGGTPLSGTTVLNTATDYWASQTVNGVESSGRFKVTATLNECYITLVTTALSNVAATSATSGGTISNNCGGEVTASGVCWSTSSGPIATGNHVAGTTAIGTFVSNLTGLISGTKYYVRAFATNSSGTAYGNEVSFTTP